MVLAICMSSNAGGYLYEVYDASLYVLKVIERTRWRQDFVRDKVPWEITQTNARVTVLALCTSSNVD